MKNGSKFEKIAWYAGWAWLAALILSLVVMYS